MSQRVLRVERLPEGALDAAGAFHAEWLPRAREMLSEDCTALAIVLPPSGYDHADWRRALARDLARQAAPRRVNVVAGEGSVLDRALDYLGGAPGVTGQYLRLDAPLAPAD